MPITQTEDRIIGGRKFTIRVLPVIEGRKVYARVQKYLALYSTDLQKETGMGPLMSVGLHSTLEESEVAFLVDAFAPVTQVELDAERTVMLGGKDGIKHQNEIFTAAYEDMFEWLDACIEINFRGVIEKMKGVLQSRAAAAQNQKE
jgi:hypothetical protein